MKRCHLMPWLALLGGISLMLAACAESDAAPLTLYVATDGNDAWSGKLPAPNPAGTDGPFASLERARDEIRRLRQQGLPEGGATVELQGGRYELKQPFELTEEDAGTEAAPITYRARQGAEVRLSGGSQVTNFAPVTEAAVLDRLDERARGNVVQADLKAQGITDFGEVAKAGQRLELFFQDKRMTLARWPNEGFTRIVDVVEKDGHQIHGIKGSKTGKFTYEGDRPRRWAAEPDIRLHGYWFWDWSDSHEKVESIDAEARIISTVAPYHHYGYRPGQRFYALNLLAELDSPGEWYLDREAGILYFWPPAPVEQGQAAVSILPTLASMKNTSYVTIRGMILEATRSTAITISGGTHNRVAACTMRNIGRNAASVSGGTANGVIGCDIHDTGEGGVSISGGDRETLTPAGNYAENNHIHHFGRLVRTYRPAVGVGGVGQRVIHNLMHHGPHNAIQLGGNDHLIEFNEVHSVCYETGDVGAYYMGRDWTARGTVIRHNYFHHIQGPGLHGAMAVYLDDSASGITIFGNVFYRSGRSAFIGGGRDNLVENNIFVECHPSVHVDARGLGWMKGTVDEGGTLPKRLHAMPYKQPPWSEKYPRLVGILDDEPGAPKGNLIARNISQGGVWKSIQKPAEPLVKMEDNLVDEDPHFVDAANLNFQLRDDSPAYKLGFKRIPIEEIGLYEDELRASWPVEHKPIKLPEAAQTRGPTPRTGPPVVFKVTQAQSEITIDGTVRATEWGPPEQGLVIEQNLAGEKPGPKSTAWVRHDGTALLVGIDNLVADSAPLRPGNTWGQDDAVEVAIRNIAAGKASPILVLRGYPSGHWESSDEPGAPAEAVKRAAQGVEYGAQVVDKSRWTAEWRIPFASLGIDPKKHRRFEFNLTVRKTAQPVWLMWQSTRGNSWLVDRAGVLELE